MSVFIPILKKGNAKECSNCFPGSSDGKSVCLQCGRPVFDPWVRKIPWRRKWQSTPVLLPGKSLGPKSLVGYSPWEHKESDTTEKLHFTSPASNVMLKILQARLQQYVNCELPDVQVGFRKGRRARGQIANINWIIEKAREFQKKHLLLLHWLP